MINDVNGNNLSNIEIYHNKVTDQPIVSAVVDDEFLEHCSVQYKYYADKGWAVYNFRCNYCDKTMRSQEVFITHIETCPALEDDYVPKPKRFRR
tara:strand:+ start:658 stop:939 length:282 start_codon:yes stop_codon:yes gene_type:complete